MLAALFLRHDGASRIESRISYSDAESTNGARLSDGRSQGQEIHETFSKGRTQ